MNRVRRVLYGTTLMLVHTALGLAWAGAATAQTAAGLGAVAGTSQDIGQWLADPGRCSASRLPVHADQPVAFSAALRAVVCNNNRLQQIAGTVTQARAELDRAESRGWPDLTLRGGVDGVRGEKTQGSAAIDLSLVLFDFGASSAAVRQSRQALNATLDDQSSEVLTAIAQAAQLYAAAQATFWRLEAANTNVHTALESQRMAKARLGAGAASQLERLQAETALAQTRLEFARAMNAWMAARGELALAMGLSAAHPLVLATADEPLQASDPAPLDVEALVQEARSHHPRVLAARARQAQAQAQAAGVASQRWGSVNLSARAGHSLNVGNRLTNGSAGTDTSASLEWSLPLLDRGVLKSQLRSAQGVAQTRAAERDEAERLTALQVWQEAQGLQGERSAMLATRSLLDSAQSSLLVSTERFRQGVGNFTDLLQAQTATANARLQWAEARANLSRAQWRLAAAAGRFGALKLSMQDGLAPSR